MRDATSPSHDSANLKAFLPPVRVRDACPHDCPDTCSRLSTVENGVATRARGNAEQAQTGGVPCNSIPGDTERACRPGRLLQSLRRVGARMWRKPGLDDTPVNQLTRQHITDPGRGLVFYDCLVQVQPDVAQTV